MKLLCLLSFGFLSLCFSLAWGADPLPLPKSTPWQLETLFKTPTFKWLDKESKVQSLSYHGLAYKEKPTSVFAYYASPASFGIKGDNFPALVLVHGGGGSAFNKWAELWAKRGYVAIAMDLAGKGANRKPLPDGGPDQGHGTQHGTGGDVSRSDWQAEGGRASGGGRAFAAVVAG